MSKSNPFWPFKTWLTLDHFFETQKAAKEYILRKLSEEKMNLNLGDTKLITSEAEKRGVLPNQLAYILATAYHETAEEHRGYVIKEYELIEIKKEED